MAVYTKVERGALDRLLAAYELGDLTALVPIEEGVENSNYRLDTSAGRFILTLYERRVDPGDLPFFLGLTQHLAERGLPCARPVADRRGQVLQELAGRPASIVTYLKGRPAEAITPAHCRSLGVALAELHAAAASFALERANALGPGGWPPLAAACGDADRFTPGLTALIAGELAVMARAWPACLPTGIAHADLFPDNVFFAGTMVTGLIDFYFACNELLAYDLAVCLVAWAFDDHHAYQPARAAGLVDGYESVRPLATEEHEALPMLARGAALRFLLTRLYDWLHRVPGALVQTKDPGEYLAKLRFLRSLQGSLLDG